MTVTLLGDAARFFMVVRGDDNQLRIDQIVDTGELPPGGGDIRGQLVEDQLGYLNSPRVTDIIIPVAAQPTAPIFTALTAVNDRTATLLRVPPVTSGLGLGTVYPAVVAQHLDPSDRAAWYIDLSHFLSADEPLATVTRLAPAGDAALMGLWVDTGDRRPAIDVQAKLVRFYLTIAPNSNVSIGTAIVWVAVEVEFTTDEAEPQTFQRSITIPLVQG